MQDIATKPSQWLESYTQEKQTYYSQKKKLWYYESDEFYEMRKASWDKQSLLLLY